MTRRDSSADRDPEARAQVSGRKPLTVRREALRFFAVAGLAAAVPLSPALAQDRAREGSEEEVSPAEDLMREHGVLNRILLIYDESISRLEQNRDVDFATLSGAAGIIRTFIEDYHEKLEENHLFPRFEKAKKLTELVTVLRRQHQAGRVLTDSTRYLTRALAQRDAGEKANLIRDLKAFVRMYRPHEAREDTVLFPALKEIVSKNEYDALGEEFEKKEHELFGEDGFESMVDKVTKLEKHLGIYDLAQFTPGSK